LAAENINTPVESYKKIYGPIRYTVEERAEWEAKMTERAKRLSTVKNIVKFVPEDYPKTDMIVPATTA